MARAQRQTMDHEHGCGSGLHSQELQRQNPLNFPGIPITEKNGDGILFQLQFGVFGHDGFVHGSKL